MAKNDIQITVKGKPGTGKSTIIRLIETALKQKNIASVIEEDEGENVVQSHMDNGEYSQRVNGLRSTGLVVWIRVKTKKRNPKKDDLIVADPD